MNIPYQIVVCGGIVPDPLQTLDPITTVNGPALKNEMLLPHVLDPWAAHALYEAAHLARRSTGSRVWLVSVAPKAKLQQVMMTIGQRVPLELVAIEGPASGFTDSADVATALSCAIQGIAGLDRSRLLVFGGWESASRAAGATMQMIGERLGIIDQFQGVDELTVAEMPRRKRCNSRHGAEACDATARHETKVAHIGGQRLEKKSLHEAIEKPCGGTLENILAGANRSLPADHIVAIAILGHHRVNHVERVLEIGVDKDDCVAGGIVNAGCRGQLVPEVPGKAEHFNATVARLNRQESRWCDRCCRR